MSGGPSKQAEIRNLTTIVLLIILPHYLFIELLPSILLFRFFPRDDSFLSSHTLDRRLTDLSRLCLDGCQRLRIFIARRSLAHRRSPLTSLWPLKIVK